MKGTKLINRFSAKILIWANGPFRAQKLRFLITLDLFIYLFYLFIYLFIYLFTYIFIYLSIYLFIVDKQTIHTIKIAMLVISMIIDVNFQKITC